MAVDSEYSPPASHRDAGKNVSSSDKHSLLSLDVLQFEVVTADGIRRIANECQNQDLFWALRGGGGS